MSLDGLCFFGWKGAGGRLDCERFDGRAPVPAEGVHHFRLTTHLSPNPFSLPNSVGSCCTQFGWCAPDYLDAAPPGSNKTLNGDLTAGINHWCSIGSCNLAASPYSPTCAAAHKLLKPAVRKFKLVLEEGYVNPDGVQKKAILVNGQFPGPTLEVNLGDQVVVEVRERRWEWKCSG